MTHTAGPVAIKAHGVIIGGPAAQFTNGSAQPQLFLATIGPHMGVEERDANAERLVLIWNLTHHLSNNELRHALGWRA